MSGDEPLVYHYSGSKCTEQEMKEAEEEKSKPSDRQTAIVGE